MKEKQNEEVSEQLEITNVLLQKIAALEYESASWQVKYTKLANENKTLAEENARLKEGER